MVEHLELGACLLMRAVVCGSEAMARRGVVAAIARASGVAAGECRLVSAIRFGRDFQITLMITLMMMSDTVSWIPFWCCGTELQYNHKRNPVKCMPIALNVND